MSKLVLRNVSRTFGDFTAVEDFNLTLHQGELVSLLGPSGCGKTSTLRMIAGFIAPTSGTIEVDGQVVSSPGFSVPPEARNMSMIFQSYAIWPNMTVAENVGFGLKIRNVQADEIRCRVDEILEKVQMAKLRDRYPAELSGGQQQRVALARAVVVKPAVLLLDEPLSNLDANLREEMRFEIRRLHDELRITTVYVTHDQAEAMVTSDRIVVMNAGRVEQVDAPYSLYGRPKTKFVAEFIGRTNVLRGTANAEGVHFGGFSVAKSALNFEGRLGHPVMASLRPQSVSLSSEDPGCCPPGHLSVPGQVHRRAYLGECWDYYVQLPGAREDLRVTARSQDVFEVNEPVWVHIDPGQLVVIN